MDTVTKVIGGIVVLIIVGYLGYMFAQRGQAPEQAMEKKDGVAKIGFIGPLSGDAATYGEPIRNSVELAVKELQVQGKKIEVIFEDGKCTGKDASSAANKLVNVDGVKIIVGGSCSGETLAIAPLAEEKKVLVLSPSASSPDVTNAGDFIFRNNPSDAAGGIALAEVVYQKHKNVAVVSENTEYAQAFRRVFTQKYKELGGTVSVDESFPPETSDFRSILSKVKGSKAEAMIIDPQTEQSGALVAKQARELGIKLPFYGHLIPGGEKWAEIAGKDGSEGTIFTDLASIDKSNPRVQKFLADYEAAYSKPNWEFYMAAGYDAVYILSQAIDTVGVDAEKIRDYLYDLPEYDGLIGKYSFDENGDMTGAKFVLKQIKNGKPEVISEL